MDNKDITFLSVGFALYALALLVRSTSLKHFKFGSIIDLQKFRQLPVKHRGLLQMGFMLSALFLIALAVWNSIESDYSIFGWLVVLGLLLICVRLLGFYYPHISILFIEIELDSGFEFSLRHLTHSPFVLGGLFLAIIGGSLHYGLDNYLNSRFQSVNQNSLTEKVKWKEKEKFDARYISREILFEDNTTAYESEFVGLLRPGKRYVLIARAGSGKTWYINKLFFVNHEQYPGRNLIIFNKDNIDLDHELINDINHFYFSNMVRGSSPFARKIANKSIVVIDGADEFNDRSALVTRIMQFAGKFKQSTILITTRPFGKDFNNFEVLRFPYLAAKVVDKEIKAHAGEISKKLTINQLRAITPVMASYIKLDLNRLPAMITPTFAHTLFERFLKAFEFNIQTIAGGAGSGYRYPFMNTYRDLNIVRDLFDKYITGNSLFAKNITGDRRQSIGFLRDQYLSEKIRRNYKRIDNAKVNDEFIKGVLRLLTNKCRLYLQQKPHSKVIVFGRAAFYNESVNNIPFSQIIAFSELMVEFPSVNGSGVRISFDNPGLDEHFIRRVASLDN